MMRMCKEVVIKIVVALKIVDGLRLITTLNFHTYLPIAADFPLAHSQTTVTFHAVNGVFATKFCFARN